MGRGRYADKEKPVLEVAFVLGEVGCHVGLKSTIEALSRAERH